MTKNQLAQQCRAVTKRIFPTVDFKVMIVGNGNNAAVCVDFLSAVTSLEKAAIKAAIINHLEYINEKNQ